VLLNSNAPSTHKIMIRYSLPSDKNSESTFSVREIEVPTTTSNVAEVTMSERYPKSGFAVNTESEMIVLIMEGSVTIPVEDKKVSVRSGTTIFVPKNTPYFWNPTNAKLYIVSTPPWTPEQQQLIPESSDSTDQP
jgi:mannose-6-phosphate isomerase-like protein (cupin superfamily)